MNVFQRLNRFLKKDPVKKRQSVRARKIAVYHFFFPKRALFSKLPYGFYWYAYKEHMSNQIYVGLHEENEITFLQKTAKSDWISMDIGANAGFYSLLLNTLCAEGKIYAYEPSAREWKRLEAHLTKNACTRIIPQRVAVGKTPGEIELFIHEGKNMGMNTTRPEARFTYTHSEKVPLVTVDDEVKKWQIKRLDFIKLDVEGLEKEVLEGGKETILTLQPAILCEVWELMGKKYGEAKKHSEIASFLLNAGYVAYQPNENGKLIRVTDETMLEHNNIIFVHKDRQREFVTE